MTSNKWPEEAATRKLARPADDTDGRLTGKPDARFAEKKERKP